MGSIMDKTSLTKQQKARQLRRANVMEAMKDLGNSTAKSLGDDVLKQTSQEFLRQLFGQMKQPSGKVTGEMKPGHRETATEPGPSILWQAIRDWQKSGAGGRGPRSCSVGGRRGIRLFVRPAL